MADEELKSTEGTPGAKRSRVAFVKGIVLFNIIFFFVFLAATPFLTFWLYWQTDLTRTMLPVLIGFCLEGAFLVLALKIFEERSTMREREKNTQVLRFCLGGVVERAYAGAKLYSNPYIPDPEGFREELAELAGKTMAEEVVLRMVNQLQRERSAMEALLPIAARVGAPCLASWMQLSLTLQVPPEEREMTRLVGVLSEFLQGVRDFDRQDI
ncbi:MAG: hypothetical protein HQL56_02310 [Magnetococcales bacterium]|nr:hypothetical protein [Magnetococcales bacterium]